MTGTVVLASVLGAALVAGAALELALRRVERRLPPYPYWHDSLTTGKWHQLRALSNDAPVDVVLAGSSQMLTALDPEVAVPPPQRAYNAGLYRGVPTVMTSWMSEIVLPMLRPRWVVWGISILDLNDAGIFHRDILARYQASSARTQPALTRLRLRSAIVRRARRLRHPVSTARLLRPGPQHGGPPKPLDVLLGPMGKGLEYVHYDSYQLSDTKRAFIQKEMVNNFTMGGEQVDAIRRGVQTARNAGADVVIVEMPSTREFHEMYPHGYGDVAAARAVLADVATELGVPFLPLPAEQLPQDWFADCVHLNGRGMKAWSEDVAERLAAVLR